MVIRKLIERKTLKAKIIQYNFIIICLIAIFISICTYVTANSKTMQIAKNSLQYEVSTISYRYQLAYEEMLNIVLNCAERKSFDLPNENPYLSSNIQNTGVNYASLLSDYRAITGYSEYISKLSVFNAAGAVVQTGTSMGSFDDGQKLLEAPWFSGELEKTMDQYHLGIQDSPFYQEAGNILPIISPLSGQGNIWVALCISDRLFQDVLRENANGQETLVVTGQGERIAANFEDPEHREENDALIRMLLSREENRGLLEMKLHGKSGFAAYERSPRSGILVLRMVPVELYKNDSLLVVQTVIIMFVACLVFGLLLSVAFTNQMKKPIDRLIAHIQNIAVGDFRQNIAIEGDDEIGQIGKTINHMSGHIDRLMEQRLEDANEKNRLELKMLQAQINPHFLYNTLDSIKWIAVIQKNSGIVKAVTALSGLLKNMAKGFNEKVTLQQELNFLADYITIEKLKYVEMFDVVTEVEKSELYQAKVIKLTLQPLVENAIFNGIEPNGKNGTIWIRAFETEGNLRIIVRDNGKGIPKEKLKTILSDKEKLTGDHMSGIGLPNVDKRLKLTYGPAYGLRVESEEGSYTQITIDMPLEY